MTTTTTEHPNENANAVMERDMVSITFIHADGQEQPVDVPEGESVMRAAVNNLVQGIVGECGGGLSCATCHVFVDPAWASHFPPASPEELDLLEATSEEPTEFSRLACQLNCSASMQGLVVRLPRTQR